MNYEFKRILVALDLSAMDKTLLRYIAVQHALWGAEKIYFVHVMPDFSMPKNVDAEFHKLFSSEYPVDEKIRDKIALDIEEILGAPKDVEITVEVREGKPYEKLLHWIDVKEIDLLIVGHKRESEGSGIMPRRVARRAKCDILFITENAQLPANILVPIDFSDNSARALQFAVDYSEKLPNGKITSLHIVEAPPEKYYMRTGSGSGFRAILTEAAKKAYHKMLETHQIDQEAITSVFLEDDYINIAARISDYIEDNDADLIVLGAQGHTALEKFFYGSVTERLVEASISKPVLVIR